MTENGSPVGADMSKAMVGYAKSKTPINVILMKRIW